MKNSIPRGVILVTGGAASGKSALAEGICCRVPGPRLYIATMESHGTLAEERIRRHRAMRSGKGFDTVERTRDLAGLVIPPGIGAALLEDTGNLVAGEMFAAGCTAGQALAHIVAGVEAVAEQVHTLVVVHNEVFSGAERYGGEMEAYLSCMGRLAAAIARRAAVTVESVCGLPLVRKGELVL